MTSEQIDYMIQVIRGYNLAFKATEQENYRITRDELLNSLEAELYPNTNVIELKAA